MAASFVAESFQTLSGTTTAWLPISTPWLSIAACSSQIYAQRAGLGGNLIAFDPLYGESINPSAIPCLPTEVTSSWYQSNTAITTVLGPTFVCPAAYSAVQTLQVNPQTQQVLCCPSQFALNIAITGKGTFPSQCTSSLTSGQTLTYESTTLSGPWGIATTVVAPPTATSTGPTIVYGFHVNGFNVLTNAASSTPLSIPSALVSTSIATTITFSGTSSASSLSIGTGIPHHGGSLSNGAKAAIGIGSVLVAIAILLGGWFMFRRARSKYIKRQPAAEVMAGNPPGRQEMEAPYSMYGMPSYSLSPTQKSQKNMIHEMAAG